MRGVGRKKGEAMGELSDGATEPVVGCIVVWRGQGVAALDLGGAV